MELTLIARVRDGLILATSIEGNNDHGSDTSMVKYSNQAKMLFKKLAGAPTQQTVESGPYVFHYAIIDSICALVLCDRNFPRKTAFQFLNDIGREFLNNYTSKIDTVVRPYHFLEFDKNIQQAKHKYGDANRYTMNAVSNELQDVTRIMVTNIEDVIHRGEALNILENRASELSGMSKKYREDAQALNRRSTIFKDVSVPASSSSQSHQQQSHEPADIYDPEPINPEDEMWWRMPLRLRLAIQFGIYETISKGSRGGSEE